jgi:hypothetical protein
MVNRNSGWEKKSCRLLQAQMRRIDALKRARILARRCKPHWSNLLRLVSLNPAALQRNPALDENIKKGL